MNLRIYENSLQYEDYVEMRESVGWHNFSREQAENALRANYYSLLLKDGDKNVSMGRIVGDGMYFLIVDVVVRPEYQKRGIGAMVIQKLVQHIEEKIPKGGRASITLLSEIGKEEFYKKQGFKLVPHEFCGPALRKVIHK